jgi:hypothetical protein
VTNHILQVVPVGKGFLLLYPDRFVDGFRGEFTEMWQARFPGVPAMAFEYAQLVQLGDGTPMFEFSGQITPAMLDEFREWWDQQKEG